MLVTVNHDAHHIHAYESSLVSSSSWVFLPKNNTLRVPCKLFSSPIFFLREMVYTLANIFKGKNNHMEGGEIESSPLVISTWKGGKRKC
jgi:hypothetical protein